jgi:hypothetical protein
VVSDALVDRAMEFVRSAAGLRNPQAWRVVVAGSRPVASARHEAELLARAPLLDERDWQRVADHAAVAMTAGWLTAHLDRLAIAVPDAARKRLHEGRDEGVRRWLLAETLRRRLAPALLLGREPPCLLLKGVSVERRAYPPEIVRPCADLDVLVRPGRGAEVAGILGKLGLRQTERMRSGFVIAYHDAMTGALVECHLRLLCPYRHPGQRSPQPTRELFARAERAPDGWLELAPVDCTVHLLMHLMQNLFVDLRHRADLGQWLRAMAVDCTAVGRLLRAWDVRRAGAAAILAVAADDDLLPCWLALARDLMPRDPRAVAATVMRRVGWHWSRFRPRTLPPVLEGGGRALHYDSVVPWLASYRPGVRPLQLETA